MSCPVDDRLLGVTNIVARLNGLSATEDFFATLNVQYLPQMLNGSRLHILKRMGQYLAADDYDGRSDRVVAARATL